MKKITLLSAIIVTCSVAMISSCVLHGSSALKNVSPPSGDIFLFSDASHKTIVRLDNPNGFAVLNSTQAEVSVNAVAPSSGAEKAVTRATLIDRLNHQDAIQFEWQDTWRAALNFETASEISVKNYLNTGIIQFSMRVDDLTKGGLALRRPCGNACDRAVPFIFDARAIAGQGWKSFSIPVSCFFHDDDDASSINQIFSFEVGGRGSIAVSDIRLTQKGVATVQCSNYKTQSVTPSPLNEWWSIDWWMPRHQQKLLDIKARPIDLVFVGDSITEGWEKSGTPVWQKYYAKRNTIALGFGGDRTENLLWRLQHGELDGVHPKLVVMMIGTNNTGHRHEDSAFVVAGIQRDIQEIRARVPSAKILLLAIFPRDATPAGEARVLNEKINSIIPTLADNQSIFFLNINAAFLDANGILSKDIMPDLLHPNEKGYEIWANSMEPTLNKLMR